MMLDCPKWSSNGGALLQTMVLGNAQRARQWQALPRALQAFTKFWSEYSSEQCSALSEASTFPLILTCASVNAWHNTKHYFNLGVLIFWLVCLLHCSEHWRALTFYCSPPSSTQHAYQCSEHQRCATDKFYLPVTSQTLKLFICVRPND